MPLLPPRRWFQYSLSTWFVLVAILSWAMYLWPWIVFVEVAVPQTGIGFSSGRVATPATITWSIVERRPSLNPALVYPSLALAAFVVWKGARTTGQRGAGRRARVADSW